MATAYTWHPITDLSGDPKDLTEGELDSLRRVWDRQKEELTEGGTLGEFEKRLRREWSIETGIIENVYTLDRGVTRTLIEKGIDAALIPHGATDLDPTRTARIIQDHYEALEGMFDFVGGQRQLSTSYVNELHAALLRNQDTHTIVDQLGHAFEKPLEKGKYKTTPNSPTRPDGTVHEYCPPEHIAAEMDRLMQMYVEHQTRSIPVEVDAAWLHHRFSQIHPFADGNGRVARAIASLVFIKAGWFPLIVKRDDWTRYIDTLEKADHEDLKPLVALFVGAQRNAVIDATGVACEVRPPATTDEVKPVASAGEGKPIATADEAIAAIRDRLVQSGKLPLKEWLAAEHTANELVKLAAQRLQQIAERLSEKIGSLSKGFQFGVQSGSQSPQDMVRARVVQKSGRIADFAEYSAMAKLSLDTARHDELVLSFYALGPRFRGLIEVVAYLTIQGAEPVVIEGGTFLINYEENSVSRLAARFANWLEQVIVKGLDDWQRTL